MALTAGVSLVLPAGGTADDVSAGVFARTDTDGTHVISPSVSARAGVIDDRTSVTAAYAADVWTSASIDIRTAATMRVSEQRDELGLGVERELSDVTVRGGYRYSHEVDYVSHGGALAVSQRLADGNATVETQLAASHDSVGRSGDEHFDRVVSTVGARVVLTQVVDAETVLQGAWEIARREGFQSSPYRFVGIGGDGSCAGTAQLCIPETHPSVRLRNAFVARTRRSLGPDASVGLAYRLYVDDWGVLSHTGIAQIAFLPDDRSTVLVRYRMYFQGGASFYRERYGVPDGRLRFVSRDRELSSMSTHRLAASWERDVDLTASGPTARITIGVGGSLLSYDEFVGLDRVFALDVTLGATVEL